MFPMKTVRERVLLVEDEPAMRIALQDALEAEGYRVLTARDGQAGLERALKEKPALLLLDVMLPGLNGFDLCAQLRRLGNPVPVLMLTAKGALDDRVAGLEAGADDYLCKPFEMAELIARIQALLRRTQRQTQAREILRLGGVEIDLGKQIARRGQEIIYLGAREFAMLRLMAEA